MKGLLVDFGGVLTTNVFDSFRAFCDEEGLDPDTVKRLFREELDPEAIRRLFRVEPRALELVRALETGSVSEDYIGERIGELLGVEQRTGLVERMFGHVSPDETMVEAVRRARAQGIRTGLVSNSMGDT